MKKCDDCGKEVFVTYHNEQWLCNDCIDIKIALTKLVEMFNKKEVK